MASRSGSRSSRSPSCSPVQRRRSRSTSRSGSPLPPHRRVSPSPSPVDRAARSGSHTSGKPARRSTSGSPLSRRTRSRSRSGTREPRSRNGGNREDPKPSQCVGVFGLSIYTTKIELTKIFEKFGPLERVQVVVDAKTGRSRGFAFVYFDHLEDAKTARTECAGMEIDGRSIRVDYSLTERPHTPTPGIYMGKPTLDRRSDRYGGGGYSGSSRGDRYRSPSPRYRSSRRRSERDYYSDGYDRGSGYERERGSDRDYYYRSNDRGHERQPSGYRSRSRSPIRSDRYRY